MRIGSQKIQILNFYQFTSQKKKREENSMSSQGRNSSASNPMQRNEVVGLIVLNEEDNENLLVHRINGEDVYRRQEDTIIAWRDHENGTELALSFQEATSYSFIWKHICNVQRSIQFPRNDDEGFHGMENDFRELPPVDLASLPQILKLASKKKSKRLNEKGNAVIPMVSKEIQEVRIFYSLGSRNGTHTDDLSDRDPEKGYAKSASDIEGSDVNFACSSSPFQAKQ